MSTVTATIYSNNKKLSPKYQVVMLEVSREINKVPDARITLIDGEPSLQKFELADSDFFKPGSEIEIRLRYEETAAHEEPVFKGIVLNQVLYAGQDGFLLTIELRHKVFALTTTRKNLVFTDKDKKDDDAIVSEIIKAAGLSVTGKMGASYKHKQLVQYYCSDWDFILSRVDANGCALVAADNAIQLKSLKEMERGAPSKITFGLDAIYSMELEMNVGSQIAKASSIAWDIKKQAVVTKESGAFAPGFGNLEEDALGKKLGAENYTLINPAAVEEAEVEAWANAKLIKSRLSLIRGVIKVKGRADLQTGKTLNVEGLGDRFKGRALISGIRHQVDRDGWTTEIQLGLSSEWFAERVTAMERPAMGLIPGINGLHTGIVAKFEEDPDKNLRIKVKIPAFHSGKEGIVWARWASLYAGNERGFFFLPEEGDEVVVGFFNDDPRQAVILGSLYSSKNTGPKDLKAEAKNLDKGIITKKGARIRFKDDEKTIIEVATPGKNTILLDDDKKGITITDQHGNTVELNDKGITFKSKKDFTIDASGNVTIKGAKIEVK